VYLLLPYLDNSLRLSAVILTVCVYFKSSFSSFLCKGLLYFNSVVYSVYIFWISKDLAWEDKRQICFSVTKFLCRSLHVCGSENELGSLKRLNLNSTPHLFDCKHFAHLVSSTVRWEKIAPTSGDYS
jgi:hypothetical protein